MNVKEMAGTALVLISLLGLGYAAALKGGWLVDAAGASDVAQSKVGQEAVRRELGDLRLQRDLALKELEYLYSIAEPNAAQTLRRDILLEQVKSISARLAELEK